MLNAWGAPNSTPNTIQVCATFLSSGPRVHVKWQTLAHWLSRLPCLMSTLQVSCLTLTSPRANAVIPFQCTLLPSPGAALRLTLRTCHVSAVLHLQQKLRILPPMGRNSWCSEEQPPDLASSTVWLAVLLQLLPIAPHSAYHHPLTRNVSR